MSLKLYFHRVKKNPIIYINKYEFSIFSKEYEAMGEKFLKSLMESTLLIISKVIEAHTKQMFIEIEIIFNSSTILPLFLSDNLEV